MTLDNVWPWFFLCLGLALVLGCIMGVMEEANKRLALKRGLPVEDDDDDDDDGNPPPRKPRRLPSPATPNGKDGA